MGSGEKAFAIYPPTCTHPFGTPASQPGKKRGDLLLNELPRSKLRGIRTNRESLAQLSPPFDTTFPSIRALRATQDGRISINRLSRVATWGGRASRDSGQTDFFADSPSSHVSVAYRGAGFPCGVTVTAEGDGHGRAHTPQGNDGLW